MLFYKLLHSLATLSLPTPDFLPTSSTDPAANTLLVTSIDSFATDAAIPQCYSLELVLLTHVNTTGPTRHTTTYAECT